MARAEIGDRAAAQDRRGRVRIRWDLRVGGRKLKPGTYLVTPRAVKGRTVRELGRPRTIRIRR